MTEKAPAFQFYPKDWISDESVLLMSLEQEGAYIRLLCHAWLHGSIPADVDQLARICRTSPARMRQVWCGVACCFSEVDGRLVNARLERQRAKQEAFRAERAASGKKGSDGKWGKHGSAKGSANKEPLANDGLPFSSPSASPLTDPPLPPASGGGGLDGRVDVLVTLARDLGVLYDARGQRRGWRNALDTGITVEALAAGIRSEAERKRLSETFQPGGVL